MRLNARQVFYERGAGTTILLGMQDVTERRASEREKEELLRQKDILFEELQHRVANSLQIIANILLLKARAVQSEETRLHLRDAHKRVMSIAAVQKQLHAAGSIGSVEMTPYLTGLCAALAASMIGDDRRISLQVVGQAGGATSRAAESLGLITTELVMNALKHAFPGDDAEGRIVVSYEVAGTGWKLAVSDNGIGKPDGFGSSRARARHRNRQGAVSSARCQGRNGDRSRGHDRVDHPCGRCDGRVPRRVMAAVAA